MKVCDGSRWRWGHTYTPQPRRQPRRHRRSRVRSGQEGRRHSDGRGVNIRIGSLFLKHNRWVLSFLAVVNLPLWFPNCLIIKRSALFYGFLVHDSALIGLKSQSSPCHAWFGLFWNKIVMSRVRKCNCGWHFFPFKSFVSQLSVDQISRNLVQF